MYSCLFPLLCRKTYYDIITNVSHFESKDNSASEEYHEINEGNFLHCFFIFFSCPKMRLYFIIFLLHYSYAVAV